MGKTTVSESRSTKPKGKKGREDPPQVRPGDVHARLAQVEAELLALRRAVAETPTALPTETTLAIEVRVGEHWYLVPAKRVTEVVAMAWPDPVADAPEWVMGVIRLGATPIVLLDLGRRLTSIPLGLDPTHTIVIVDGRRPAGFCVEAIGDLVQLDPDDLEPPASGLRHAPFVSAAWPDGRGGVTHLLDPDCLASEYVVEATDE